MDCTLIEHSDIVSFTSFMTIVNFAAFIMLYACTSFDIVSLLQPSPNTSFNHALSISQQLLCTSVQSLSISFAATMCIYTI